MLANPCITYSTYKTKYVSLKLRQLKIQKLVSILNTMNKTLY